VAIHASASLSIRLDCFFALLLAMTLKKAKTFKNPSLEIFSASQAINMQPQI